MAFHGREIYFVCIGGILEVVSQVSVHDVIQCAHLTLFIFAFNFSLHWRAQMTWEPFSPARWKVKKAPQLVEEGLSANSKDLYHLRYTSPDVVSEYFADGLKGCTWWSERSFQLQWFHSSMIDDYHTLAQVLIPLASWKWEDWLNWSRLPLQMVGPWLRMGLEEGRWLWISICQPSLAVFGVGWSGDVSHHEPTEALC